MTRDSPCFVNDNAPTEAGACQAYLDELSNSFLRYLGGGGTRQLTTGENAPKLSTANTKASLSRVI